MNTKVDPIIMTNKTSNNIAMKDYNRMPEMINNPMEIMGRAIGMTSDDIKDKTFGATTI